MAQLAFGRYTSYKTPIHGLDPRTKIISMILLLVTIFMPLTTWSTTLILAGIEMVILLFFFAISKIKISQLLSSLKAMVFLIIFLLIIYLFVPNPNYNDAHIIGYIGSLPIYWDAFYQAGYIIIRIVLMLMIVMLLTTTTSPMDLTYGLEWYMTPLTLVKFPSHIVAMTLAIALRFIPTLIEEVERIMKAQSSRGVDYTSKSFFKKFGAIIALIIPLFVSAIQRSEELSNAMEARGYNPYAKRSKYRQLKFGWNDLFGVVIVLLIFGAMITLKVYDANVSTVDLIQWIFKIKPVF